MTYEDCMLAILANPEDDVPRHELANVLRSSDPQRAEFIERQLAFAIEMRETKYSPRKAHGFGAHGYATDEEDRLLEKNKERWIRDLSFFMGELPVHRDVEFHRGLPWLCCMNPYTFLEQGEYIFTRIAPLRGIEFFADPEGAPFPIKEIAASPLLERLDVIRIGNPGSYDLFKLEDDQVAFLAASPHLKRLLLLDVRRCYLTVRTLEAFAANPDIRKCLTIQSKVRVPSDNGPPGEFVYRDDWGSYAFEMSDEGRELERKYGYLPWLHRENGGSSSADAHYWVDHKVLPRFVPGSPADAPTPYGDGLYSYDPAQPRAEGRAHIPDLGYGYF